MESLPLWIVLGREGETEAVPQVCLKHLLCTVALTLARDTKLAEAVY